MAGVPVLPAEVLLAKRVQDMVLDGQEPPLAYIGRNKDDDNDNDNDDATHNDFSPIPVIDLNLISSSSTPLTKEYEEELRKLKSALSSWGCFQAIGHGISSSFLDKIRQVGREFFERPMEEKNKISKTVVDFEGYGADPVPEEGQSLDWSDRLLLEVYPEDQRNYRFWPEYPQSFREVLEEYTEKMKMVIELTSKAMAKSLKLEENCFLNQFGEKGALQARFNYYLKCQRPDIILGLKPHSDGSAITVILEDEMGLQIQRDEKWFTVPINSQALLIQMGDQMEIITNGIFKSPVHRVLSHYERERISIAVFFTPEIGKEIGPEDGLVSEERPRLFKKVKDYSKTHWGYYQRGMRALHIAKA